MNCYNRINNLINEMTDDINYIKTKAFLNSIKKN